MKRFYYGILWLALGAICWMLCLGAWAAHGMQWGERVSYRDPDSAMSFDGLEELRRQMEIEGEGAVTGWGQSSGEQIEAAALGGTTSIDVIWFDGDASRIWSPPMKRGQMPIEGDDLGCALDEKTALKLFGSLDIVGLEVNVAGRDMIIRGVYPLPEGIQALGVDPGRGLAFCPADLSDGAPMTALDFSARPADGKTAAEQARDWMQSAGLSASGEFDDHEDANDLMRLLGGLPGDVLALAAVIEICLIFLALSRSNWGALKRQRADLYATRGAQARVTVRWLLQTLSCAAVAYAAVRLSAHGGKIPPSYLPTRWSDFSFWPRLIEGLSQDGAQARMSPALRPDMIAGRLTSLAAVLGLGAVLLFLMARRNLRGQAWAGSVRLTIAGALVYAAPAAALWIGEALGWRVTGVPNSIMALPAASLILWTIPALMRSELPLKDYIPALERRNARVTNDLMRLDFRNLGKRFLHPAKSRSGA